MSAQDYSNLSSEDLELLGYADYEKNNGIRQPLRRNKDYIKGYFSHPNNRQESEEFLALPKEEQKRISEENHQKILWHLDVLIKQEGNNVKGNQDLQQQGFDDAVTGKGSNSGLWYESYAYQKGFLIGWKEYFIRQGKM